MGKLSVQDKFDVWANYMRHLSREGIVFGPISKFELFNRIEAAVDTGAPFFVSTPINGAVRPSKVAANTAKLLASVDVLTKLIAEKQPPVIVKTVSTVEEDVTDGVR
jgi:hypothetical protein